MTAAQMTAAQSRALAMEEVGTPWRRTKAEARAEAHELARETDTRAGTVTQSTWMGASGDSYCLHLDSRDDGLRVSVHRWYSTGEVDVRLVFGSWWRPRAGREGVLLARTVTRASASSVAAAVVDFVRQGRDVPRPIRRERLLEIGYAEEQLAPQPTDGERARPAALAAVRRAVGASERAQRLRDEAIRSASASASIAEIAAAAGLSKARVHQILHEVTE